MRCWQHHTKMGKHYYLILRPQLRNETLRQSGGYSKQANEWNRRFKTANLESQQPVCVCCSNICLCYKRQIGLVGRFSKPPNCTPTVSAGKQNIRSSETANRKMGVRRSVALHHLTNVN